MMNFIINFFGFKIGDGEGSGRIGENDKIGRIGRLCRRQNGNREEISSKRRNKSIERDEKFLNRRIGKRVTNIADFLERERRTKFIRLSDGR